MSTLDLTADEYHADQTGDQPTLSASIARILCAKTPAHARAAHPRLNPDYARKEEDKFDLGNAVHSLLLQGIDLAHVCHYDSWRTNDAKDARATARAHGRIPLLQKNWNEVEQMLTAVRLQVAKLPLDPPPFTNGEPEKTIVWEEDGVACRARLDWLHEGALVIDDLKSTSASAEPAAWRKTLYGMGGDLQAAMYVRGVQAVYGTTFTTFRWIVAETYPPFAVSVVDLAPAALALANEKLDWAIATWKRCLDTGEWPGYVPRVASIDPPAWEEARWLERQALAMEAAA